MGYIGELRIEGQAGALPALLGADIASGHALREKGRRGRCRNQRFESGPSGYVQVFPGEAMRTRDSTRIAR